MLFRRAVRRLTQGGIFTVPNALTLFRLLLIPFFVHFFFTAPKSFFPLLILSLSALSDILDGFIARRFGMISDFGKFLDPLADKLTQAALLLCLSLLLQFVIYYLFMNRVTVIYATAYGALLPKEQPKKPEPVNP